MRKLSALRAATSTGWPPRSTPGNVTLRDLLSAVAQDRRLTPHVHAGYRNLGRRGAAQAGEPTP